MSGHRKKESKGHALTGRGRHQDQSGRGERACMQGAHLLERTIWDCEQREAFNAKVSSNTTRDQVEHDNCSSRFLRPPWRSGSDGRVNRLVFGSSRVQTWLLPSGGFLVGIPSKEGESHTTNRSSEKQVCVNRHFPPEALTVHAVKAPCRRWGLLPGTRETGTRGDIRAHLQLPPMGKP